jgi:hypothetical protein
VLLLLAVSGAERERIKREEGKRRALFSLGDLRRGDVDSLSFDSLFVCQRLTREFVYLFSSFIPPNFLLLMNDSVRPRKFRIFNRFGEEDWAVTRRTTLARNVH